MTEQNTYTKIRRRIEWASEDVEHAIKMLTDANMHANEDGLIASAHATHNLITHARALNERLVQAWHHFEELEEDWEDW